MFASNPIRTPILLLFIFPNLLSAQWLEEEMNPEFQEALDTLSINTLTPVLLWKIYLVPKNTTYHFFEYRAAFGSIIHHDELWSIEGLDSSVVQQLRNLPLFPPKPSNGELAIQNRFSHSPSATRLTSICQFSTQPFSGALVTTLSPTSSDLNPSTSAYVQSQIKTLSVAGSPLQLTTHIGHFSLRAGQGLLLGGQGFPAPTTAEYFASGIRGKTGTTAASVAGGCGAELQWRRHRMSVAGGSDVLQSCYGHNTARSELGVAQSGQDFSGYFKVWDGAWRAYGELATKGQRVGFNYFQGDVLFEANFNRSPDGLWGEHYLSWSGSAGRWIVRSKKGAVRVQWTSGAWDVRLSEHLGPHPAPSTWRWRARYSAPWSTVDLHYHGGTAGVSVRQRRNVGGWQLDWATAWVHWHGQPVWLAVPVSRGSIGAMSVYDDFAGLLLKAGRGDFQCSVQWNAMRPGEPRVQMSYMRRVGMKELATRKRR